MTSLRPQLVIQFELRKPFFNNGGVNGKIYSTKHFSGPISLFEYSVYVDNIKILSLCSRQERSKYWIFEDFIAPLIKGWKEFDALLFNSYKFSAFQAYMDITGRE